VRLGCPVTTIEHGETGVTVQFREFGEPRTLEADYLVSRIALAILRTIAVKPAWPEWKQYVLKNVNFSTQSRVLLQARTPFWKGDLPSINLETGESAMNLAYETADEVPGDRTILMGSGKTDVTADEALAAFTRVYPGKRPPTIEQAYVHNWAKDPWAFNCERSAFPLDTLKQFWPHIMKPGDRIHFAGSHPDNLNWGMDAATRSANRVAQAIHEI
jgi:monoamine oxidase